MGGQARKQKISPWIRIGRTVVSRWVRAVGMLVGVVGIEGDREERRGQREGRTEGCRSVTRVLPMMSNLDISTSQIKNIVDIVTPTGTTHRAIECKINACICVKPLPCCICIFPYFNSTSFLAPLKCTLHVSSPESIVS